MDFYLESAQMLLDQPQFRFAFEIFRSTLMLAVGLLTMLVMLHILYYLGFQSLIYRKKPPVDHWNRRFFSAVILLIIALLFIAWGMGWLLAR